MKSKTEVKTLNLGVRKVCPMNFSKIVTLPKPFTDNWLVKTNEVQMSLTHDGRLMLTPVKIKKEIKKVE